MYFTTVKISDLGFLHFLSNCLHILLLQNTQMFPKVCYFPQCKIYNTSYICPKQLFFASNLQSNTLSSDEAKAWCHHINKSIFIKSAWYNWLNWILTSLTLFLKDSCRRSDLRLYISNLVLTGVNFY